MKKIIIDKFKEIFHNFVNQNIHHDQNALLNYSIALYIATYFDENHCGT